MNCTSLLDELQFFRRTTHFNKEKWFKNYTNNRSILFLYKIERSYFIFTAKLN